MNDHNSWFKRNPKKALVFFNTIVILVLIIIIEFLSGFVLKYKKSDNQYIYSNLYEGYSWVNEYRKQYKDPISVYNPYTVWKTKEYQSELFNFDENGIRKTLNYKDEKKINYNIYFFGASTIQNPETIDSLTIPSWVIRNLNNSKLGEKYNFTGVNFGTSAYTSTQELFRFLHEYQTGFKTYNKPDLVVFYNGASDIWAGVYLERPGYHDAYDRIKLRFDNINLFYLLKIKEKLIENVDFFKIINQYITGGEGESDRYFETRSLNFQELSEDQSDIYLKNIEIASSIMDKEDIKSIYFIQPTIFSTHQNKNLNNSNKKLFYTKNYPNMHKAYDIGYSELKKKTSKIDRVIDISDVFNGINSPIFSDNVHIGPYGNEIISKKITESIIEKYLEN